MTASNLSICVGPSLLWSTDTSVMMDVNYSKDVSSVTQLLVEEYFKLYGEGAVPYAYDETKNGDEEGDKKGDEEEKASIDPKSKQHSSLLL